MTEFIVEKLIKEYLCNDFILVAIVAQATRCACELQVIDELVCLLLEIHILCDVKLLVVLIEILARNSCLNECAVIPFIGYIQFVKALSNQGHNSGFEIGILLQDVVAVVNLTVYDRLDAAQRLQDFALRFRYDGLLLWITFATFCVFLDNALVDSAVSG